MRNALELIVGESGPNDLLALMGVDGMMIANRFESMIPKIESRGWERKATLPGVTVLHRKMPSKYVARSIEAAIPVGDRHLAVDWMRERKLLDNSMILLDASGPGDESAVTREFAPAQVKVRQQSRNKVVVDVTNPMPIRNRSSSCTPVVPGYRAGFNGEYVDLSRAGLIMPAVRLPHARAVNSSWSIAPRR